jgi:hypothetical protein
MTFIEVRINEDEPALAKEISDAYVAVYNIAPPDVRFGRVIVWNGRLFQEILLPETPASFEDEDRIFRAWKLPNNRARLQLGSARGGVFTTPPNTGEELVARIKEGGRCGKEYTVQPFHCSDYRSDA